MPKGHEAGTGKGKCQRPHIQKGSRLVSLSNSMANVLLVMLANLIMVPWNDYLPAQQKVRWWKRAMILTGCQR